MPIIKSAIKKLRVDKKRAAANLPFRSKAKSALKIARSSLDKVSINQAYSALDKAVKKKLMSRNTVSRLKSRLVRMAKVKGKTNPFAA